MAKIVTLVAPVWDEALQRSIMPIEGPQIVDDETAAEWRKHDLIGEESEHIVVGDVLEAVAPAVPAAKARGSRRGTE